jgi:two-component system response regulator WspF
MKLGLLLASPSLGLGLRRVLEPAHEVRWLAMEDAAALRLCRDDPPGLLLVQLDSAQRVAFIRRLMDEAPCPVLLLDLATELNTEWVFNAMGHGALDVAHLPGLAHAATLNPAPLLRKIQNIERLTGTPQPALRRTAPPDAAPRTRLVAIGASAGGPAALSQLLHALPPDLDAALVLVQHLDDQFSAGMAEWLARESPLPVRLVQPGEAPQPGVVLLAGRNEHLCLGRHGELRYTAEPTEQIYRPSIDVFFHSLAEQWQGDAIGVLLTGMGRDGALGLKAMRERGFPTITQDQASSAVWGMPKAAVAIGAAAQVLPLNRIAARLTELCSRVPTRRIP